MGVRVQPQVLVLLIRGAVAADNGSEWIESRHPSKDTCPLMRFRRFVPLLPGLLLLVGCRDREIRSYRVPKEPVASATPATAPTSAAPAAAAALTWTAPSHWTEKPAGGFRRGSFTLPGSAGDADFSIIAFPGDAGGLLDNLNRWRNQLALEPVTESEMQSALEHIDGAGGMHFDVVDFTGTAEGKPTRILGAVVSFGGESWFFKVMGPVATVEAEHAAFLAFLDTVKPASP